MQVINDPVSGRMWSAWVENGTQCVREYTNYLGQTVGDIMPNVSYVIDSQIRAGNIVQRRSTSDGMKFYAYGNVGSELKPTGVDGSLRTAYRGQFGSHGIAHRYGSVDMWDKPFKWTGRMRVHSRAGPPFYFEGSTVEAHYRPAIVFHPLHQDNEHNIVMGFGGDGQKLVSISAELPTGYGVRTGYVSRERADSFNPVGTGWHSFEVKVYGLDHYELWWDGELLAKAIEKKPTTLTGAVGVGLRLDFFDVEVADMKVEHLNA